MPTIVAFSCVIDTVIYLRDSLRIRFTQTYYRTPLGVHRRRGPGFVHVWWVTVEERARSVLLADHVAGWPVEVRHSFEPCVHGRQAFDTGEPGRRLLVHPAPGSITGERCKVPELAGGGIVGSG